MLIRELVQVFKLFFLQNFLNWCCAPGGLQFPARCFGFPRELAVFCGFLRPQDLISRRTGEAAKSCALLPQSGTFSLGQSLKRDLISTPGVFVFDVPWTSGLGTSLGAFGSPDRGLESLQA